MSFKVIKLKDLIDKWNKWSKKGRRKDHKKNHIQGSKWTKKLVRSYQKENQGKNPLSLIPKNTYYCKSCPFWYTIEIPKEELDNHIGIVAMNQTHIGGCKLLKKTDDDMGGFGLLWDACKECGINYGHR